MAAPTVLLLFLLLVESKSAPCMWWGEEFDDLLQISNSDSTMPLSWGAAHFAGGWGVWRMGCVSRVHTNVLLCALRLLKYVLGRKSECEPSHG